MARECVVKVLVISGSMGAGKTTVLGEASDILNVSGIPHAAIDLDALGLAHLPAAVSDDLMIRNLAAVWNNYAPAGITRLLLSEALDDIIKRERLRQAVPGADIIVCRLRAKLETMQQRIRLREPGMLQEQFVARVAELEASLDAGHVEDFSVENDGRSITEVAREVLVRAGWL
jgi:cytidylate kinase